MSRTYRLQLAAFALAASGALLVPSEGHADNPIIQTIFSTDPAPMVDGGRLYVYTGHDEDGSTAYVMKNWWVWSTVDMVNWTAHGSPLSLASFSWAAADAWAGQCIPRNGKYYWYVPVTKKGGGYAVGVAVSDSPTGPFTDALVSNANPAGAPLVANGGIDPTVFIDDDDQAYLYYGGAGSLHYAKLNADMISISPGGGPVDVTMTTGSFGVTSKTERPTSFEEGAWLYKRNGLYYMLFSTQINEYIAYSTSSSPIGPWTYRGVVMPVEGTSFTNHSGIVDFLGNSYFFYHNGALPGGGGYQRSVAVEKFTFNVDGSIPTIHMTAAGAPKIANLDLDPYSKVEAETIAWASGVKPETCSEGGMDVTSLQSKDYIKVESVAFGAGAASFQARVASTTGSGEIQLRLEGVSGTLVGKCPVPKTGGAQTWATVSCKVAGATGTHDLFLVFVGDPGDLFNFNWWKFASQSGADTQPPSAPSGLAAPSKTSSAVSLSWTASTDNVAVTSYLVFRQQGSGAPVTVGLSAGTTFQVTGLVPGTDYQLFVQAQDASGNVSASSSSLSVTTMPDTVPPSAPTELRAAALTQTGLTLLWTASTDDFGVTGYAVYEKVGSAARTQLGTTDGDTTSFAVSGLVAGTTYVFNVEAIDAAGNHSTPAASTVTLTPEGSGGGSSSSSGCAHGTASGLALVLPALWLLAARRRWSANDALLAGPGETGRAPGA